MTYHRPPRVNAVQCTLTLLLLFSFVPYSFPENMKPDIYRGHPLTNVDLKCMELDAFLDGKIEDAPLGLNLEERFR